MPQYKVIAPGFFNGKLYSPTGKRNVLSTDKPFTKKNPMPSWLTDMPKESPVLKAKREAAEKAQAELDKAKAEEDANAIATASTEGDGAESSFFGKVKDALSGKDDSGNVETL